MRGHVTADDGTRLAYRRLGDGPRVVTLLHSLALDGSWFLPLARALGDTYSFVVPDFRGHGESGYGPAPVTLPRVVADVVTLWDSLGVDGGMVCGVSLGGMIAQGLVAEAPERVRAVALMATTGAYDPQAREGTFARAAMAREPGGMARLEPSTLERWFGDAAQDAGDPLVASARARLLATDGEIHAAYLEAMTEVGSFVRPQRPPPTLVVGGIDDRSTPPVIIEALAASIPGARLSFTKGGHLAAFTDTDAVAPLLGAFFDA